MKYVPAIKMHSFWDQETTDEIANNVVEQFLDGKSISHTVDDLCISKSFVQKVRADCKRQGIVIGEEAHKEKHIVDGFAGKRKLKAMKPKRILSDYERKDIETMLLSGSALTVVRAKHNIGFQPVLEIKQELGIDHRFHKTVFTDDEIGYIRTEIGKGSTMKKVRESLDCGHEILRRIMKENNIVSPAKKTANVKKQARMRIIEEYLSGSTINKLALRHDVQVQQVFDLFEKERVIQSSIISKRKHLGTIVDAHIGGFPSRTADFDAVQRRVKPGHAW
jgi:hypothetical protein